MRTVLAFLLLTLLSVVTANRQFDGTYGTAGSEDIYMQPQNSIEEQSYYDSVGDEDNVSDEESAPESQQPMDEDNLQGIGEDAISCEYSCPRYYRPICVRRNGELVTFNTPCEYQNRVRCANVAKRESPGQETPTYELMYNNACHN